MWIVPKKAVVYENAKAGTAYVVESRLKVMLEEDYVAQNRGQRPIFSNGDPNKNRALSPILRESEASLLAKSILQEIVIPALTKEINEGQHFAQLRQVYNSLILAQWYKKKIKDSILNQVYANKNIIKGTEYTNSIQTPLLTRGHVQDKTNKNVSPSSLPSKEALNLKATQRNQPNDVETIYQHYLQAFKKGAYNLIKEEQDPISKQMIPKKYFSGGFSFESTSISYAMASEVKPEPSGSLFQGTLTIGPGYDAAMTLDNFALNALREQDRVKNWLRILVNNIGSLNLDPDVSKHVDKNLVIVGDINKYVAWGREIVVLGNFTWSVLKKWPDLKHLYVVTKFPEIVEGIDPRVIAVSPEEVDRLPENMLIQGVLNFGQTYEDEVKDIREKIKSRGNQVIMDIHHLSILFSAFGPDGETAREKIRNALKKEGFEPAPLDQPLLKGRRGINSGEIFVNPYGVSNRDPREDQEIAIQRWAVLITRLWHEKYKVRLSKGQLLNYHMTDNIVKKLREMNINMEESGFKKLVKPFNSTKALLDHMAEHARAVITPDSGPFHAAYELLGIPTVVLTTEGSEGWIPKKEDGRFARVNKEKFMNLAGEDIVIRQLKKILTNPAMTGNNTGGIDMTSDKALTVENNGQAIKLKIDPALLAQWKNAQGIHFDIINLQPMDNLGKFLGLSTAPSTTTPAKSP